MKVEFRPISKHCYSSLVFPRPFKKVHGPLNAEGQAGLGQGFGRSLRLWAVTAAVGGLWGGH